MKELIAKLLRLPKEIKYIYVPDYRGRLLYNRTIIDSKSGMTNSSNNIYVTCLNESEDTVEVVVYKYTKNKSKLKK